jgi:hypothetical protein
MNAGNENTFRSLVLRLVPAHPSFCLARNSASSPGEHDEFGWIVARQV